MRPHPIGRCDYSLSVLPTSQVEIKTHGPYSVAGPSSLGTRANFPVAASLSGHSEKSFAAGYLAHHHPCPIFGEPIEAMEKLKKDGKIRHYGVSNFSPAMMDVCESTGHLAANQVGYHLFDRRVERAVLPYAQAHGIGFMAYGSFGFGLLSGAFTESTTFVDRDWRSRGSAFGLPLFQREQFLKQLRVVERLKAFAARHGKSVAQLAISWVLGNPAVTVGLVGIRRTEELKENVAAVEWRLSAEERQEIDRIFEEEGVPTHADTSQIVEPFLPAR